MRILARPADHFAGPARTSYGRQDDDADGSLADRIALSCAGIELSMLVAHRLSLFPLFLCLLSFCSSVACIAKTSLKEEQCWRLLRVERSDRWRHEQVRKDGSWFPKRTTLDAVHFYDGLRSGRRANVRRWCRLHRRYC